MGDTVRFSCFDFPNVRVLIARGRTDANGRLILGTDKFAEFKQGGFQTDDAETIAKLRKLAAEGTSRIYEDDQIDPERVPIAILNDQEGRIAANARRAAPLVTGRARRKLTISK